jgi:Relaxase/Mobilisation nuclease domain
MNGRIRPNKSLYRTLSYNELKVLKGMAELLLAENFIKDTQKLSHEDKLHHFNLRITLNERVEQNTLHITINFGNAERIDNDLMKTLARQYMDGIGYGDQPYLVYRHNDAAHEHLHVVTTNLRPDGSQIVLDREQLRASHRLTGRLEKKYALIRFEKATLREGEKSNLNPAARVIYGKAPTRDSINRVLSSVIDQYKYTNLDEFNAILREYNIKADRGSEGSFLYKCKGLLYQVLDDNGRNIGKCIKASSFPVKPTLTNLEKKFALNESLRQEYRQRITVSVDWSLAGRAAPNWSEFKESLRKDNISVVAQEGKKGSQGSIYFIDHQAKSVFEGAGIGTKYSMSAIRERCAPDQDLAQELGLILEDELTHRLHHGL